MGYPLLAPVRDASQMRTLAHGTNETASLKKMVAASTTTELSLIVVIAARPPSVVGDEDQHCPRLAIADGAEDVGTSM